MSAPERVPGRSATAHVVHPGSFASAGWGETTIAAGDLAEAITRLKQERSGGYLLARVFAAHR